MALKAATPQAAVQLLGTQLSVTLLKALFESPIR